MTKGVNAINWDDIMDKFSLYEGSIASFCKENNISHHNLYYRRKRLEKANKPTFHAIKLDKVETNGVNKHAKASNDIRIEIGKANIYIPSSETSVLSDIVKELTK